MASWWWPFYLNEVCWIKGPSKIYGLVALKDSDWWTLNKEHKDLRGARKKYKVFGENKRCLAIVYHIAVAQKQFYLNCFVPIAQKFFQRAESGPSETNAIAKMRPATKNLPNNCHEREGPFMKSSSWPFCLRAVENRHEGKQSIETRRYLKVMWGSREICSW